jgi:RNA polymerase sigma factor (sigma-70 family)
MPFLRARAAQEPGFLARFGAGDRQVLAEVYRAYVSRVEDVARRGWTVVAREGGARGPARRVPGDPLDAVADIVQETFVRAFSERARLSDDGLRDYGPYLTTIARHLLVDQARARGREITLDALAEVALGEIEPSNGEPWADPDTMRVVEAYLAQLDDDQRRLHDARYVRNLSQEAAATELAWTRQMLRTREAHLRDGLKRPSRRFFNQDEDEPVGTVAHANRPETLRQGSGVARAVGRRFFPGACAVHGEVVRWQRSTGGWGERSRASW